MAGDRAYSLGPDQPDAASRAIPLAGTDHCVDQRRLRFYAQSDSGAGNAGSLDGDGDPDATILHFIMVYGTVRRTYFGSSWDLSLLLATTGVITSATITVCSWS